MPTGTGGKTDGVLLDTSTAIALLVEDHGAHAAIVDAVRGRRLGLAGNAWFETYSVLTRLPAPLRRMPADAARLLSRDFPATVFLSEAESTALIDELARLRISGGAVYDALVGAAAREHGHVLLALDGRDRPAYEALGVEVDTIR